MAVANLDESDIKQISRMAYSDPQANLNFILSLDSVYGKQHLLVCSVYLLSKFINDQYSHKLTQTNRGSF